MIPFKFISEKFVPNQFSVFCEFQYELSGKYNIIERVYENILIIFAKIKAVYDAL